MEDLKQIIQAQGKRINELERSNQELKLQIQQLMGSMREVINIINDLHPVTNQVPVNRINWVKESLDMWRLTVNEDTYLVYSSSTHRKHPYDEDYSVEHAAHNMFTMTEGDLSRWASECGKQHNSYIIVNYPRRVKINYLRVKGRCNEWKDQCPSKFEVRGSNQNGFEPGKFRVLLTVENFKLLGNEVKEIDFNNEEEFEYYSIFIIANNGSVSSSFSELNFGYRIDHIQLI